MNLMELHERPAWPWMQAHLRRIISSAQSDLGFGSGGAFDGSVLLSTDFQNAYLDGNGLSYDDPDQAWAILVTASMLSAWVMNRLNALPPGFLPKQAQKALVIALTEAILPIMLHANAATAGTDEWLAAGELLADEAAKYLAEPAAEEEA